MPTTKKEINWSSFSKPAIIFFIALIVISCKPDPPTPITQYINGTVTDAYSGEPIEGAQIVASGGYSATSQTNGTYSINLPVGIYTLTVSATGYSTTQAEVVVPGGRDVTQDFELTINHPPDQPALSSPPNGGTGVSSLMPELQTGAFSDPDTGNTHAETQWQISVDDSFSSEYIILDVTSDFALTSLVPELIFDAETEYYWQVRFRDNHLLESHWSDVYSFTTITDSDDDGMPDTWEDQYGLDPDDKSDASGDLDGDGINNLDEYRLQTDPTKSNPIGGYMSGFICGTVTDAYSGEPIEGAQIVTSGRCLTVSLENGSYLMVHLAGTYTLAVSAADYYSITRPGVVVAEGGIEEQDIKLTLLSPTSPPSGAGGGGCFIATAAYGSPMELHVKVLREFRDRFLLTNYVGKAFIDFYSTYSPPVADFIGNHDSLKVVVRWSLLPVVGVSWMAINFGSISTLVFIMLFLSLISLTTVVLFKRICQRENRA